MDEHPVAADIARGTLTLTPNPRPSPATEMLPAPIFENVAPFFSFLAYP
jgi:hypothetical protein